LHDDRRIRIRIHTSDKWIRIRIREAQKDVDPVDPDPQHCFKDNKSLRRHKTEEIKVFLNFLLVDRKPRIRTNNYGSGRLKNNLPIWIRTNNYGSGSGRPEN
jgi:hypothetical protein